MTDGSLPDRLSVVHVVALVGSGGEFGGPVSVAEADARELAARGHTVVVTGLSRGVVRTPAGLSPGHWRTFPARRIVPRSGMLGMLNARFLRSLWTATGQADVVHVHAGRDLVSLSALLIGWLRSTPIVVQTHGMVLPRRHLQARLFDPVFLRLMRRARTILFMTEAEQHDLSAQLGADAPLVFLGNGLELPPLAASSPPSNLPPQVLFLARLHPVKQVLVFAEMAALLTERGVSARYVVHGPDQGDLEGLRRAIDRDGLGERLSYQGPLDHEQALKALSASAVYVLPSLADWMPMSLLEAMATGVPSVCTTYCGLADVLRDTGAAIVTGADAVSLADAVERILGDPAEAERLARRGREVVAERFSISAVVDDLERIYTDARRPEVTSATTRSRPSLGDRFSRE